MEINEVITGNNIGGLLEEFKSPYFGVVATVGSNEYLFSQHLLKSLIFNHSTSGSLDALKNIDSAKSTYFISINNGETLEAYFSDNNMSTINQLTIYMFFEKNIKTIKSEDNIVIGKIETTEYEKIITIKYLFNYEASKEKYQSIKTIIDNMAPNNCIEFIFDKTYIVTDKDNYKTAYNDYRYTYNDGIDLYALWADNASFFNHYISLMNVITDKIIESNNSKIQKSFNAIIDILYKEYNKKEIRIDEITMIIGFMYHTLNVSKVSGSIITGSITLSFIVCKDGKSAIINLEVQEGLFKSTYDWEIDLDKKALIENLDVNQYAYKEPTNYDLLLNGYYVTTTIPKNHVVQVYNFIKDEIDNGEYSELISEGNYYLEVIDTYTGRTVFSNNTSIMLNFIPILEYFYTKRNIKDINKINNQIKVENIVFLKRLYLSHDLFIVEINRPIDERHNLLQEFNDIRLLLESCIQHEVIPLIDPMKYPQLPIDVSSYRFKMENTV